MNAPTATAALTPAAFNIHLLVEFTPSTTRTQARRRARFKKEEIAELAANIKAVGIMQPIVARPIAKPLGPVKYEIVAGERRWLAAAEAGLVEIPALIRSIPDADLITLQLTENLQRKTIDQIEEAEGYAELRTSRKINADQVADLLGVSRTTVFNRLKLLDLCTEARASLDEGKLTPSVALLIARLPDPKMQAKATKGCLGDLQTLKGFEAENSPWNKPLTHEDAEQYIKEEFTARIDGTAAINKAKSEGKPVIAGKQAEEIWKRSHAGPAGYVQLSEHYWMGQKRQTYASVLGDNPLGTVLIQSPHTGAAEKCLPRADAIRIFKEKKLKLPNELEPPARSTSSGPEKNDKPLSPALTEKAKIERAKQQAKERRQELEAQLEVDVRIATFKAMRAKYPSKLGKPELIEVLDLINKGGYYRNDRELAPSPKSLPACTERELVREVLDSLYCPDDDGECAGSEKRFLAAAKRYGVNVEKIRKELSAKAEAILKEEAAAAKAKLSKTVIHPKDKWPFPTGAKVPGDAKKKKKGKK